MTSKNSKEPKEKNEEIKLRVVEAMQDDVYRGIARIDYALMKELGLQRGDIISVKGGRETFVIVDKAYPADEGARMIRIDGITRRNAKTGIGEFVSIKKADLKELKKVVIAPAQPGIIVQGSTSSFRQALLGRPLTKGDIFVIGGGTKKRDIFSEEFSDFEELFGEFFNQFGMGVQGLSQLRFVVVSTNPPQAGIISENTEIVLNPKSVDVSEESSIPQITYEDIGGLTEEVKKIREMVELPLKHPEIFARLGIEPPKGVLLYGPPGTGKTLLAKAVANESEAHFILLNGPEIMSKFYGESEKKVREIFEEAKKNAPAIIFIDEIDAIAPKREDVTGEVERRVVSQLLTMMDGLNARGKVIVIGATNRPNALDPALRRPGRFDREIEVGVPDKEGRLQILKIHTRGMPLDKDVNLEELANRTHGFVGADLQALTKEAAMSCLRRNLDKFNLDKEEVISEKVLQTLKVTKEDFENALKIVRPSAMREVLVETPNVKWEDIGGIESTKRELREAIEWPLKYPEAFKRLGIKPPKGVLLYGPPGTGKTLLAKAVANESEANFIQVKGPELLSMWVGKSEEGVRKVFEKARQVAPCIIFFDEIDSLASRRGLYESSSKVTESVLNQLLAEMDGIEELSNVIVIGATNRPDILDPALLRPGRFDRIVYVPVPDEAGRLEILKIHTKNVPIKEKEKLIEKLSKETEGYTGADLEALVREAAMLALRENKDAKEVTEEHFKKAMEKVAPSVSKSDQERYKQIEKRYLRSAKSALPENSYMG
ncbi:MAG: CDC48 family AAA ATPase [Candidatus Pacearchaeota archaeon]